MSRPAPPAPDRGGPPHRPRRLRVFAVEPDAVQIDWTRLGPGSIDFHVTGTTQGSTVEADGGPGAVDIVGLTPDHDLEIRISGPRTDEILRVRTPPHPPGEPLFRFASMNDLHIGESRFGYFDSLAERPEPEVLHPVRCARAAVEALHQWGAELVIAKGDLTDSSRPEHWAEVASLIEQVECPVLIAPGNHETHRENTVEPEVEAARHGLHILRAETAVTDVPGLRIITADTPIDRTDVGRIGHVADSIIDAAHGGGPAFLAVHHHFQPWRVPTHPPPGIPGPEARRFLDALAIAEPRTFVSSGHTHRHRRNTHGPIVLTETGSTKDYPGTWAGYVVHEGGIRQVVKRIAEPSCIRWTEWSGRAALGMWRHWSPGRLADRSFSHPWPTA